MTELKLRDSHRAVRDYYTSLRQYSLLHVNHEGAVKDAFGHLLDHCAKQFKWTIVGERKVARRGKRPLSVDAALLDEWGVPRGYWEAKDENDDLEREAREKIKVGYPTENILFQSPGRAILYQDRKRVLDQKLDDPRALVDVLKTFFRYKTPEIEKWETAVEEFGGHVPRLGAALLRLIDKERRESTKFSIAFTKFLEVCRSSINPQINDVAVEKMLAQHILTERIFRKVFDNSEFTRRNVIAVEIEKVIEALIGRSFNRRQFLGDLDHFYTAIEQTAASITNYSDKQHFLNTVYERFFQSFDRKTADTHGIVYTPQPIVQFMVRSVDELLQKEFGRSLGDQDVHIIDPFVGTGNFVVNVMRHIPRTKLESKYANELHANEIMLLPYYIASMNIEHEYADLTGSYKPFEGICLVDTFEIAEPRQKEFSFLSEANAQRVALQRKAPIFVVLGNPPYNAGQANENDNNKNRKYPALDARIRESFVRESKATLKSKYNDTFVRALRWAFDRLGDDGLVAFVTNANFATHPSLDGIRGTIGREFDEVYVLDLGGDVRRNPKLSGTKHNVFGIQVGVAISFFVRRSSKSRRQARVFYASTPGDWRREQKLRYLERCGSIHDVDWTTVTLDTSGAWVSTGPGTKDNWEQMLPIAARDRSSGGNAIFRSLSLGVSTNRDSIVYGFQRAATVEHCRNFASAYNSELARYRAAGSPNDLDSFVRTDGIKWSETLKRRLASGRELRFSSRHVTRALYRPFTSVHLCLEHGFVDRPGAAAEWFSKSTEPNVALVFSDRGHRAPFSALATAFPADLHTCASSDGFQVVPLKTSAGDNISDWALGVFRERYCDPTISAADVFFYVYAVLHHKDYLERFEKHLKRELPRIPLAPDFWLFADSGKRLIELHTRYEDQPAYRLEHVESQHERLNWSVSRMRLSKDRTSIVYNDFLTLSGLPPEAFEYRLGNRSALEWIVDQFKMSTDKRSGITNDPNRPDDPQYIVRLIGQVVTVSVETMKIIKALPSLDQPQAKSELRKASSKTRPKPITKAGGGRSAKKVAKRATGGSSTR